MADPLSPQQRPLGTIGEDSLPAENSTGSLEAASPNPPPSDPQQNTSTVAPQREDGLHAKTVAAKEDGREEKENAAVTWAKGASGTEESFDDPDHAFRPRQRSLLIRVLSHWKRTARNDSQESTPSENWRCSYMITSFTHYTRTSYIYALYCRTRNCIYTYRLGR